MAEGAAGHLLGRQVDAVHVARGPVAVPCGDNRRGPRTPTRPARPGAVGLGVQDVDPPGRIAERLPVLRHVEDKRPSARVGVGVHALVPGVEVGREVSCRDRAFPHPPADRRRIGNCSRRSSASSACSAPFRSSIRSTSATTASRGRAARQGGHVLPDGRLGLDGRARKGSRQAFLHPAAPVPQAQIRAGRHRVHPPHPRGRGGRRAGILLRPRTGGTVSARR